MDENNKYMLDLIDGAHGRTVKLMGRIIVALIIAIVLIVGGFLWCFTLYDYISTETVTEYEQDSNGLNIIADGTGVSVNGTTLSQGNDGEGESAKVQQQTEENGG